MGDSNAGKRPHDERFNFAQDNKNAVNQRLRKNLTVKSEINRFTGTIC